jgi:predicted Rossmann-fold nucleotide-binding protein
MPGGFGTLDEAFDVITLVQTGKLERFPVVAMGQEFWDPLTVFIRDTMFVEGTIAAEDVDFLHPVETVEEALQVIRSAQVAACGRS